MKKNIQVVLVRPDSDGNIGAVCRAMKTTDLSKLAIVGRKSFDENEIRTFALHAYDIFTNASLYTALHEATAESVLSIGITRRKGKRRKYISYPPEIIPEKLAGAEGGRVSLVFGNEEHGLTDEELAECDMAAAIPSSEGFPSLNLSHAVQIIGYTIFTAGLSAPSVSPPSAFVPAFRSETAEGADRITGLLEEIGFFSFSGESGKEEMSRFFRDIMARAMISREEMERLVAIFRKAAGLAKRSS